MLERIKVYEDKGLKLLFKHWWEGGGVVSHVCLMRNSHAELGGENRFLEFRVAFCGSTRVKSPPPLGPKGLQ